MLVSAGVPIRDLALFMALSLAVLGAAIALFVYYAATPWIGSLVVCIALAVANRADARAC